MFTHLHVNPNKEDQNLKNVLLFMFSMQLQWIKAFKLQKGSKSTIWKKGHPRDVSTISILLKPYDRFILKVKSSLPVRYFVIFGEWIAIKQLWVSTFLVNNDLNYGFSVRTKLWNDLYRRLSQWFYDAYVTFSKFKSPRHH